MSAASVSFILCSLRISTVGPIRHFGRPPGRYQAELIPMTDAPETGAINRLHFSGAAVPGIRVSFKSDTGFVWYQIPAPIRTLFYSKREKAART